MTFPLAVYTMTSDYLLMIYLTIMGLACFCAFEAILYLWLRYKRIGPLGKAELGNLRGFIGVIRDLNGKTDVKRLNPSSRAIMDTKDGSEVFIIPENVGCNISQGPTLFMIEARSGVAVSPQTIRIAKALSSGQMAAIESKDGKGLIMEFAEKIFYPNYQFQWPIRLYLLKDGTTVQLHADPTSEVRAKLKVDEPQAYELWRRDSLSDQRAFAGFDVEKKDELSFMNEIRTGVRRTVLEIEDYGEDAETVVVHPKLKTIIPQEPIDKVEEQAWRTKMAKIGSDWPGWKRYVNGEALDVSAMFGWMATGPSPTDIKGRDNWLWQKWESTAVKGKTSNTLAFILVLMALGMGFLMGTIIHV